MDDGRWPALSLLANELFDEVHKELEKRGHAFVRHGDDLRVLVASKGAGVRVMQVFDRIGLRMLAP